MSAPEQASTEPALTRIRALLDTASQAKTEAASPDAPYLDLLEGGIESSNPAQSLMESSLLPRIYERYWRPAFGRVAMGVGGPGMAEEIRIARLLLGLRPGDGVLDVACGPGNFSRAFASTVGENGLVVGLDASETMLNRGAAELERTGLRNLALVRGSATALPFVDSSFDATCCFAALYLFEDPFAALDEMARVLTPGGRIAVMTSVQRKLAPRGPAKPVIEKLSGLRIFGQDEVVEALRERGFTEIHQRLSGLVQFVGARLEG